MKCPYCEKEMTEGYIVTDGNYIAFRKERHKSARVNKEETDEVQLEKNLFSAAAVGNVYRCSVCKKIILEENE